MTGLLEQLLNGVQLGMLLFLISSGLTLIFGVMHFINLAHGSLYMAGAFALAGAQLLTDDFLLSVVLALAAVLVLAVALETTILRQLYRRDHLAHVLATFALIIIADDGVKYLTGGRSVFVQMPQWLSGTVELLPGMPYPLYRLVVTFIAILVSIGLYVLIRHTRIGMLVRAGASDQEMVRSLGVNIKLLYTIIFVLGALLAGFAGMLVAPMFAIEVGMGETILILVFVIICIGGVGSVRGTLVAALLVGMIDTMGRAYVIPGLALLLPPREAAGMGPAVVSILTYVFMAVVLLLRPRGLLSR